MYTQVSLEHRAENGEVFMDTSPTSRFATALKQARLKKRWKQEQLAKKLHVTLRAVVSWETGARIPSAGMVFLLCMLLADDTGHEVQIAESLRHDLLISYLIDDMQRQIQVHPNEAFRDIADQGIERLSHLAGETRRSEQEHEGLPLSIERADSQDLPLFERSQQPSLLSGQQDKASASTLQQLFTLFEQLHKHPELIEVTHDFLSEMTHV